MWLEFKRWPVYGCAMHPVLAPFAIKQSENGLTVHSPHDGALLATLPVDGRTQVESKVAQAAFAQQRLALQPRRVREALLVAYADALKAARVEVAAVLAAEAGKTQKEAQAEVDSAVDTLHKTIKDATLPPLGDMLRVKERAPVGVVGLITSFNFPISVAHWSLAPALLAANAVVWKPSEKTPLTALAVKKVWGSAAGEWADALQVVVGARETGEALVACEAVDMVSATGSVAMGEGIRRLLAARKNTGVPPILELGGNNGAIISRAMTPSHLEWSLAALMHSFLGTTGQRCTNTRRLFVQHEQWDKTISILKRLLAEFMAGPIGDGANAYGYAALIDADAFHRFEAAKARAQAEGGELVFGQRLPSAPQVYKVEPALALMPTQTPVMHEETFAPLLFIAPYAELPEALAMLNAPDNAGLVAAIYTQSQPEADAFALHAQAGHVLINSARGTGTPAHGMGFGGNKHSGSGEVLNSVDPLAAFTRTTRLRRIAQHKDIAMDTP
jgi:aldehyde dehydrogenase (NAD+)